MESDKDNGNSGSNLACTFPLEVGFWRHVRPLLPPPLPAAPPKREIGGKGKRVHINAVKFKGYMASSYRYVTRAAAVNKKGVFTARWEAFS